MIKKYFALSLVTASMVVAGCSSDSNPVVDPDPDNPPAPTSPAADITNDSSAFDVLANSTDHTSLLAAINAAGLGDTLDDPAGEYTIFAPTDAAFAALDEAEEGSVAALLEDTDALTRLLQFHVVSGTLTGTQISEGVTSATEEAPFTATPLLTDGTLTFTNPEAGLSVNGVVIATPDLAPMGEGAKGVVHSIGTVLEAPAAPEPEPEPEPNPNPGPNEGAGTAEAALQTAGNFSQFIALFAPVSYDTNAWTVFAPTDAAVTASGVTPDPQNHIGVNTGALTAAELIAAGSITTNGNIEYAVTGTEEALLIGGFAASLVATGDAGALVYSLEGVLQ